MSDIKRLSSLDNLLLIFNILFYRVDALISNLIDGLIISTYIVIYHSFLGSQLMPSSIIVNIMILSLIQHYVYSPVYLINDILDYRNRDRASKRLSNSFYIFRPVYFYNGSIFVVLYFGAVYSVVLSIIVLFMNVSLIVVLIYVASFITISIVHSLLYSHYRVISFTILRLLRYLMITSLIKYFIDIELKTMTTILVISTIIIPYLIYSVIVYAKNIQNRPVTIEKMIISFLSSLLLLLLAGLIYMGYIVSLKQIVAISLSWFLVIGPAVLTRSLLRGILGEENLTIYQHIARLLVGLLMVSLSVLLAFFITNLLIFCVDIS